jgi:hypothetical protein
MHWWSCSGGLRPYLVRSIHTAKHEQQAHQAQQRTGGEDGELACDGATPKQVRRNQEGGEEYAQVATQRGRRRKRGQRRDDAGEDEEGVVWAEPRPERDAQRQEDDGEHRIEREEHGIELLPREEHIRVEKVAKGAGDAAPIRINLVLQ